MEKSQWHSYQLAVLLRKLGTREGGLSQSEARERLAKYGKNELAEAKRDPWYTQLLSQFSSLPILMLLAAAAISLFLGLTVDDKKLIDAVAIAVAVLIAVFFGFFQEYKAERALDALKKMVVQRSLVMRGGKDYSIDSYELVQGDIVLLEEGSRVPADMRLIDSTNLALNQSMLTGESRPSSKRACALPAKTSLSEQENMIFSGTVIVRGHCKGVVVATGMGTEFGRIAEIVSTTKDAETPLQHDMDQLSSVLGIAGLVLASLFFAVGVFRGETMVDMFVVAVTLAVAVIPEGLPTVLAITLALGVQKMASRNAIVRKMAAVETLGSATVICTDKTGTITQNRMEVQRIVLSHETYDVEKGRITPEMARRDPVLFRALEVSLLCNNAMVVESDGKKSMSGDPTETALLFSSSQAVPDFEAMRLRHKPVGEVPFGSDRKMMSVIRLYQKGRVAFVKGAPESILRRCSRVLSRSGERKFTSKEHRRFTDESHDLGSEGMRVLALAYRPIGASKNYTSENTEHGLTFVGLVGMEDPPRSEVPEAISLCKRAGIRVIMITGDSLQTGRAIASRVGLLEKGQTVVDGPELTEMNDERLRAALKTAGLFARVTPEQKYRIVSMLMQMGEVVAVTGDGVNDAPALKKADIGIAMGLTGTDVSKEVSEIVLTDDNFASIVKAVRYGRVIFNNIKSFVRYQLSTNVAALSLMFSTSLLQLPFPLYPIQILWINIMIDGPPALALGAEPSAHDEMDLPPRKPKAPFLSKNLIVAILFIGLTMASISLSVFICYLAIAPERAVTATFTLFVFLQLFNALNCRSASRSVFSRPFSNPYIFLAILVSLMIHLAIVYLPALEDVFKTVPLLPSDFVVIVGSALVVIFLEEGKKKMLPRFTIY